MPVAAATAPMWAPAVMAGVGGLMGGLGGDSSANDTKEAWTGYDVSNGGMFNPNLIKGDKGNDTVNFGISGPTADLQNQMMGGATDMFGYAINNPNASAAGQLGRQFLDGIHQYDPMQIAQMQYEQFMPIMQDDFDQANLNMEGRQFAQGRLGSTGGSNQFNALLDSQQDSQRKLLFDSFGQGLAAQNHQMGMASGLMQLDPQLRGLWGSVGNGFLGGALDINTSAANMLNTATNIGGAGRVSEYGGNASLGMSPLASVGAGFVNAGAQGMANNLGNMWAPHDANANRNPWTAPAPTMNTPWGGV